MSPMDSFVLSVFGAVELPVPYGRQDGLNTGDHLPPALHIRLHPRPVKAGLLETDHAVRPWGEMLSYCGPNSPDGLDATMVLRSSGPLQLQFIG